MSHDKAKLTPAPAATPLTAQTTGISISLIKETKGLNCSFKVLLRFGFSTIEDGSRFDKS